MMSIPSTNFAPVAQSGAAAYFIVIAQSIFANRLLKTIEATAPNLDPLQVFSVGASDVHRMFGGRDLDMVLGVYMVGIKDVFACALACSALAVLLAFMIPFKKLPNHDKKNGGGDGRGDEEAGGEAS